MPAQPRSRLTVQDLLDEPALGLTLVAGKRGATRQVGGVHISEMVDPTPWLAPRDVLLTTGLALKDNAKVHREYVQRLSEAGLAALGYAAGITEEGAPATVMEAAEETGLPLFEVSYEVPFKSITSYIFTSLLSTDMHRLRRSLSVQNHLLSLLVEEKGADHLVSSLSMLLSVTVILYDAAGDVVSLAPHRVRIDKAQAERIWKAYTDAARTGELPREMAFGDLRLVFREVRTRGRVNRVLALALPAREHMEELTDVVLGYSQKLLALDLLKSRDSALLQRKLRADLLDELIAGTGVDADHDRRLLTYHIDPARPLRLLVFDTVKTSAPAAIRDMRTQEQLEEARAEIQATVEAALADQGMPAIAMSRGDTLIVLFQAPRLEQEELRGAAQAVRGRAETLVQGVRLRGGLSEAFTGARGVPRAHAQAREAVRLAASSGRPELILFSDLGPSIRALENQDVEQLALFYESTIGRLRQHDSAQNDELVHSLEVFLEERRSVSQSAKRLYVHQNTMRYRLKKIETLLGIDLDDSETLVDLYLGLRAGAILQDRGRSKP